MIKGEKSHYREKRERKKTSAPMSKEEKLSASRKL